MAGVDAAPPRAARSPFLRRLLIGLAAGVAVGLFLGDSAAFFGRWADAFVKLLQMAVLPYVTVSIIGSLGALRLEDLRTVGSRAILVLVTLWALALGCAFLMPLMFPHVESGRFFSTTLLEKPPPFDIVNLYIPANPFFALANNIVPGVVVFSIVVGIALIGVPRRQVLLDVLETASDALSRVMRFVIALTPLGVFAIAATTAGTLRIDQVQRLELYFIGYGTLALLLALWVLPALVSALTPIPIRAIFAETGDALVTAAVAGDYFIVLPVLITACKELVARHASDTRQAQALPDVIVPVSYNFPHSGKLLSVSFVLFAAWFSDVVIPLREYPRLAITAVVSLFGSINSAMPFLLDTMRVPADTFQLFVASGVINSRFGTLVAAMHTVTMALLATCAATGALRWRVRPLTRYALVTTALAVLIVGGVRLFGRSLALPAGGGDLLASMRIDQRAESTITAEPGDATAAAEPPPEGQRLSTMLERRLVRVCYLSDSLPFAFTNGRGELVGLDVAAMHRLAREMKARIEFVPIDRDRVDLASGVARLLHAGSCDLAIGGIAVTTGRAGVMQLSSSYLDETVAFVVRDDARGHFESWDAIRDAGALTIAIPDVPYYKEKLQERLPQVRLRPARTMPALFTMTGVAAIAMPAERGSAWTLRYPQYSVVVPQPDPIRIPLAFAMPPGEPALAAFVDTWIDLKQKDGTFEELYRYWVLGRDESRSTPRWSILRDVLHWVD